MQQAGRAAILRDSDYARLPVVEATITQLARNPKGYFLKVEWDMHTDNPTEMDDMILCLRPRRRQGARLPVQYPPVRSF